MTDLTKEEQANVRAALRFLRARCGTWATLAKSLGLGQGTVSSVASTKRVSPLVAFRVARSAEVTVDDVLTGRFPSTGTCPHCGRAAEG